MDIVHLLKKALVFGFASLALLPPVLLFAFDMGKWLAALLGLFWLPSGIFIGLFSFIWLNPRVNPAGNREAQALLAKARTGDMDAQFALATACMERQHGLGNSQVERPFYWYQQAADQGHSEAASKTAEELMLTEEHSETDSSVDLTDPGELYRPIIMIDLSMRARQRAAAYCQQAAAAGHVRAMGRLGHMYLLGNAVERDSLTAYLWLARAVSAAHTLPDTEFGKWESYRDEAHYWDQWRDEAYAQLTKAERQEAAQHLAEASPKTP
jgi:TPR repeat protein